MPGYVEAALVRFSHPAPSKKQHSPYFCAPPVYGKQQQAPIPVDESAKLDDKQVKYIQQVVGTLLYYARAVDPTILVALGSIAEQQSKATVQTLAAVKHLLDYVATHPDAAIRYNASDMQLHVDSDASYLSMPQARSRAGGFFFLSARNADPDSKTFSTPPINGAIHVHSSRIRNVMASAAEAELGALYDNAQEAAAIRTTLDDMGRPQQTTAIKTDNSTAAGIANNTLKQRKSRSMDMKFYWIRDRTNQKEIKVYWKPGVENNADYFTKHFTAKHHQQIRAKYIHDDNSGTVQRNEKVQPIQ